MKPRIFLGSAAARLAVLERVKEELSDTGDCVLWTNAFSLNKSNLDSLVRQAKLSDFSLLLAMKDDVLIKKGETFAVARDNVVFEFGLFLGATGLNHAFLLAEDGIDLPSDLDGITISKFTLEPGKFNSLEKKCGEIKKNIIETSKGSDLGLLPSTALAIGYYYNFVRSLCDDIHNTGKVVSEGKDFGVKRFKLNVIIPANIDDGGIDGFKTLYYKKHGLNSGTTATVATRRGYPFVFKLEPPEQSENDKIIDLYDVPGTLNTISEALKIYMPRVQVGQSPEVEHLERRELANFAKVLNYLILQNVLTNGYVHVHSDVTLD
jgi:hypothetical protein